MKFITKDNYKKLLLIDLIAIVILLFLLVSLVSFAYYSDTYSLKLMNAKVGNFNVINSDYAIEYYIEKANEEGIGTGKYKLVNFVPAYGYKYSSYVCENNSTLTIDETTNKVALTSGTLDNCSVYYNVSNDIADIAVTYMLEDSYQSGTYHQVSYAPIYGYKYSNSTCANNSKIIYNNDLNQLSLYSTGTDKCYVYYKKTNDNIRLNVFLVQNNVYEYVKYLDTTKKYQLNSKSICFNSGGKISSSITFNNKQLVLDTTGDNVTCNVYFEEVINE